MYFKLEMHTFLQAASQQQELKEGSSHWLYHHNLLLPTSASVRNSKKFVLIGCASIHCCWRWAPEHMGSRCLLMSPSPHLIRVPQQPPLSPPPPISNYCSFQTLQRVFTMASRRRSIVEKLILNSYSDHFLCLPFFDRTPRSRDIAKVWRKSVKTFEILAGADFFVDANILWFGMAGRYNQAGTVREESPP